MQFIKTQFRLLIHNEEKGSIWNFTYFSEVICFALRTLGGHPAVALLSIFKHQPHFHLRQEQADIYQVHTRLGLLLVNKSQVFSWKVFYFMCVTLGQKYNFEDGQDPASYDSLDSRGSSSSTCFLLFIIHTLVHILGHFNLVSCYLKSILCVFGNNSSCRKTTNLAERPFL